MHYSNVIEQELKNAALVTRGHSAAAPGLRAHSIGDTYPLTVIAVGVSPTQYQVFDCRTGNVGERRPSYQAALIDLYAIRVRDLVNS